MQRVLLNLGRMGAAPAATVAPTAVARASQPTQSVAVEEHEGYVHLGFEEPICHTEVAAALTDLSTLGGCRLPALAVSGPLIEAATESEASSEGGDANGLLASVDEYSPFFQGPADSPMDLLASAVTNLLNDESVVGAISAHLARDPAFAALMDRLDAPALPAPARLLLLEELPEEAELAAPRRGGPEGQAPLVALLAGIQRGVALAAVRMGEAFCHLGNFLRGLGESLSHALAGMDGSGGPDAATATGSQLRSRSFQAAVLKVSCAVAVVVFTRRLGLAARVMA